MPGDTKIKRYPHGQQGWIDVDEPSITYPTRRLARDARRLRLNPQTWTTTVTHQTTTFVPPLTGLDARLYDRLTTKQGVTRDEALEVINSGGYNRGASYGHMRAAGATHAEALVVVNLDSPPVSVGYGVARASGLSHTDALRAALSNTDD